MNVTTNSSFSIAPLTNKGDWDWVEIHWSKKDSWDLDTYSCPILDNVEGMVPGVDAIPEKDMNKSIRDLYDKYSEEKEPDFNLHQELKNASEDFEKDNGIICSAVRQWIIIEVAFNPFLTPDNYPKYPEIEVWAFLQSKEIGNKASMKKHLGYVIDDMPRGGWYRAVIKHIEEGSEGAYNPHLLMLHERTQTYTSLGRLEWKTTTEETKTSRLHKQPDCMRYLIKMEVVVRNIETEEDRRRKREAVREFFTQKFREQRSKEVIELLPREIPRPKDRYARNDTGGDEGEFTISQLNRWLRFETGSYLKIWARNMHFPWGNAPAEADTDAFMENMHLMDSPDIRTADGKRVDMTFVLNYLIEKGSEGNKDLPKDWYYDSPFGYFRPYSYKNHVWKRNRFSMHPEGRYEKDTWYYVGLWPTEVVRAVEGLEESLFRKPIQTGMEPSEANVGVIFGVSIAYVAILGIGYKIISGLKEGDDKKKKMAQNLQKLLGAEDFPKLAAIFASYGFPDKEEQNWLGAGEGQEKTFANMKSKFSADVKKNGSVTFFHKFYKLLQALTTGALDMLDDKETAALINTIMAENPASDSDFEGFKKTISILDQKIGFEIAKGHYTKRLGGSILPPPYLMWLAYTVSLKLTYGVLGSGEFKSLSDMKISISPEGSAGVFIDLGAIWTMSRDLGEAYTGKVDRITDNHSNDNGRKKDPHPFADTLEEIFSYVDIQIGCGTKLSMKGNVAVQMDLSSGDKDKEGKEKERFKFPDDEKPSFTVSLSMPIYGKLSVLSKEFKAVSCDLLFVTPSAAALLPTGLYLGDVQLWEGADGLRHDFGKARISGILKLNGRKEYCIGEEIVTYGETINVVTDGEKKPNAELPFFQTYMEKPNSPKIELETKSYYVGYGTDDYDEKIKFISKFIISQNKLYTKEDYARIVDKLLKDGYASELHCCYSGDVLQIADLYEDIKIMAPRIKDLTICNKKEVYEITDLVEIEFSLANLKQKDLSLYLKVYEKNSWAAGGYEEVKIENHYKGDVRGFGYFLCKQKHGVLNEYSCIVSLGELEKIDRFIMEYGDWDLCFSISLDYEGKHCILFANEERYSETIQFKRE